MSRPKSLDYLIIENARFIKNSMEVMYSEPKMNISIQFDLSTGPADQNPLKEDKYREIYLRVSMLGSEKLDDDSENEGRVPRQVFQYDGILVCGFKRNENSHSKKSIDELLTENFWHYGPIIYQIVRARMLQIMREHAIPFASPIDLNSHGLKLEYSLE